jgi:hypothetical protein
MTNEREGKGQRQRCAAMTTWDVRRFWSGAEEQVTPADNSRMKTTVDGEPYSMIALSRT